MLISGVYRCHGGSGTAPPRVRTGTHAHPNTRRRANIAPSVSHTAALQERPLPPSRHTRDGTTGKAAEQKQPQREGAKSGSAPLGWRQTEERVDAVGNAHGAASACRVLVPPRAHTTPARGQLRSALTGGQHQVDTSRGGHRTTLTPLPRRSHGATMWQTKKPPSAVGQRLRSFAASARGIGTPRPADIESKRARDTTNGQPRATHGRSGADTLATQRREEARTPPTPAQARC